MEINFIEEVQVQSLLDVFGTEAIILVCTPDATSRCFVTFQISQREERTRLPSVMVVLTIRNLSFVTAGAW